MRQTIKFDAREKAEREDSKSFYELLDLLDFRDDLGYK